jgi:hypothetical protein
MRECRKHGRLRNMSESDDGISDRSPAARWSHERERWRRLRDRLRGTFAPLLRASLKPIAMACLRLVTRRPELLFNVPRFRRCIADLTRRPALLPYLAIEPSVSQLQGT